MSISILSLNTRGLVNPQKRRTLFNWLKLISKPHLILLQEIHSPDEANHPHSEAHIAAENEDDNHPWQREWGRPAIWSYHSAILSTHPDTILSDVDIALEGRVLKCVARFPLLPYPKSM
ncbi:uncharacterized protein VTP21DRAFT_5550 [Calcarisporiella thermophila]|uniref:uncharacterized protein n=1 Tax=Calcarisporiella thermophila TaxID=911321 RepID=UPI0037437910